MEQNTKEREQLLQDLQEAYGIIKKAEAVTRQYNDLISKKRSLTSYRKVEDQLGTKVKNVFSIGCFGAILFFLIFMVVIVFIINATFDGGNWDASFLSMVIKILIMIAVVIVIGKKIKKSEKETNERINQRRAQETARKNEEITRFNQEIAAQANEAQQQYNHVMQLANERLGWYPPDYLSSDAVTFFISTIQNYRADNMKEAINLYDQELYRRKSLAKQEEIISTQKKQLQQQKVNNVLQGMNLAQNIYNGAKIDQNTAAINQNTAAVNRGNATLDKLYRGFRGY